MSEAVIKIENLGKQYRLGQIGTGTFSHDVNRWWYKIRGKEDPYLKVGEENDRSKKGSSDFVWALKDISFEVNQGDVLGIVGKNGAGKSTLLKILSRVTGPTTGEMKVKGRIASLLEVGTGFHPDLTGRENIFLNGAILGMTKKEILKKFDEIVDFSGVERYIDTPVKRYSSGMYVRLAFGVAAHLESEILILDEVLSVGDADFQKKCLSKVGAVAGKEGRTVLFVSHNMAAIKSLCTKGILLKNGLVNYEGDVQKTIDKYFFDGKDFDNSGIISDDVRVFNSGEAKFTSAFVIDDDERQTDELYFKQKFKIKITLEVYSKIEDAGIWICLVNSNGEQVTFSAEGKNNYESRILEPGTYDFEVEYDIHLMPKKYSINLSIFHFKNGASIDLVEGTYYFSVTSLTKNKEGDYPWNMVMGYVEPTTNWKIKKI